VTSEVRPAEEIRQRAAAGAALIGIRTVAIWLLGVAGTVVLARLLVPRDFGFFAVGAALTSVVALFADAGIAAALIRSKESPPRILLETLFGFRLVFTLLFSAALAVVAWPFGDVGKVAAVTAAALPIMAVRTPGAIVLERELHYRPLAKIEVSEACAYYGWAVVTVAAGWGVWGLATAVVARAVAGSTIMLLVAPPGLLRPRLSFRRVRPLLGFGVQYQSVALASVVRDQGLNVATAAIGGVATLGVWTLASRVLQVPFLLFGPLWRVSYPAFSRLLASGEEARPMIERGLALLALCAGALLAVLVGSSPALVPVVFGPQWAAASDVLPPAALGLMLAGPVSVVACGYLYAVGDSGTVLRAVVLNTLALGAVALPLLPLIGIVALGFGWLAAGVVETVVLGRALSRRTSARVARHLAAPTLYATGSAAAGWLVATSGQPSGASVVLSASLAGVLYVSALVLTRRPLLTEAFSVAGRAVRGSLAAR
jgi:O-antigen/teichoic acid export membrane protein